MLLVLTEPVKMINKWTCVKNGVLEMIGNYHPKALTCCVFLHVPLLRDPNTMEDRFESKAINAYLNDRYAK